MIQLQCSVDFTSYSACKSVEYFKGVGSTQTSIFSPNTVFHSLHYSQESLCHACSNRFLQGNYHHISFIWAIKSGVLTMLTQKICHKGLLHLQKIVSQPHTAFANLNIQKWDVYHHKCQGRKLQQKKLYFHKEKD